MHEEKNIQFLEKQLIEYSREEKMMRFEDTALSTASERGFLEIIKYIHEFANMNGTSDALIRAIEYGHLEIIKYLHEVCNVEITDEMIETIRKNPCKLFEWDKFEILGYLTKKIKK